MMVKNRSLFQSVIVFIMSVLLCTGHTFAEDIRWTFGESSRELQLIESSENSWEIRGARRAPFEIAQLLPELTAFFPEILIGQSVWMNGRLVNNETQLLDEIVDLISTVPLSNASFWFTKFNKERERIIENSIAARPLDSVLTQKSVLLVTHASGIFDVNQAIAPEVDELTKKFRNNHEPIIYIMNRDELYDLTWFPQMRDPDYVIESTNGHFEAQLNVEQVTMTGGYFSLCFNRSLNVILKKNIHRNFIIKVPLKGVYEDKYFFPLTNPDATYLNWFEKTKAAVSLDEILNAVGVKSFKSAIESLFERKEDYQLTIKLRNQVLKNFPAKRPNARKIQLIFE